MKVLVTGGAGFIGSNFVLRLRRAIAADLGLLTPCVEEALASLELVRAGLAPERVAIFDDACTMCDANRFHSYRRDGPDAGRLFHYIVAKALARHDGRSDDS